jgi:predicted metal-dependent phosphoesterase TrpH
MAGVEEASDAALARGMKFLPGIEITAVDNRKDIHMLAYFLGNEEEKLAPFLVRQRSDRVRRAREMSRKLSELGVSINIGEKILRCESMGEVVGRPDLANALLAAGHVASVQEAFDRFLGDDCPAYVPRKGMSPGEVVRVVTQVGGVTALAHPGLLKQDSLIPNLARNGLDAIEVYHSDHDLSDEARYLRLSEEHGLAVSGGSDFHGGHHRRAKCFGKIGLPRRRFSVLIDRLKQAHNKVHGVVPLGFGL